MTSSGRLRAGFATPSKRSSTRFNNPLAPGSESTTSSIEKAGRRTSVAVAGLRNVMHGSARDDPASSASTSRATTPGHSSTRILPVNKTASGASRSKTDIAATGTKSGLRAAKSKSKKQATIVTPSAVTVPGRRPKRVTSGEREAIYASAHAHDGPSTSRLYASKNYESDRKANQSMSKLKERQDATGQGGGRTESKKQEMSSSGGPSRPALKKDNLAVVPINLSRTGANRSARNRAASVSQLRARSDSVPRKWGIGNTDSHPDRLPIYGRTQDHHGDGHYGHGQGHDQHHQEGHGPHGPDHGRGPGNGPQGNRHCSDQVGQGHGQVHVHGHEHSYDSGHSHEHDHGQRHGHDHGYGHGHGGHEHDHGHHAPFGHLEQQGNNNNNCDEHRDKISGKDKLFGALEASANAKDPADLPQELVASDSHHNPYGENISTLAAVFRRTNKKRVRSLKHTKFGRKEEEELLHELLPYQQMEYLSQSTRFTYTEIRDLQAMFKNLVAYSSVPGDMDRLIFHEVFIHAFGITNDVMLDQIYNYLDADREGSISYTEWVKTLSVILRGTLEEQIKYCYAIYDLNGDGGIGKQELIALVQDSLPGSKDSEEQYENVREITDIIMRKFDKYSTGGITKEMFRDGVLKDPLALQCMGQCLPDADRISSFMACIVDDYNDFATNYSLPSDPSYTTEAARYLAPNRARHQSKGTLQVFTHHGRNKSKSDVGSTLRNSKNLSL